MLDYLLRNLLLAVVFMYNKLYSHEPFYFQAVEFSQQKKKKQYPLSHHRI